MERSEVRVLIDWGTSSEDFKNYLYESIYDLFRVYGGDWLTIRNEQGIEHVITLNGNSESVNRMVHSLKELAKG